MDAIEPPFVVPRQKRGQETMDRLLDAAEEEIRTRGLDELGVTQVVSRAGFSVGAFYYRFRDKNALIQAVQERFHARLEPMICEELAAGVDTCKSLGEAVEYAFTVLIEHVTAEEELTRAFIQLSASDSAIRRRAALVYQGRRSAIAAVLLPHREEIGHDDPESAVEMAFAMYSGLLRDRLFLGPEHVLYYGIGNEETFGELKKAITLYLRGVNCR